MRTYPEGVTAWVDVAHADLVAAKDFYAGLFGWSFVDASGSDDGPRYLVAQLDGKDVAGLRDDQGLPPGVAGAWNTYVAVDDGERAARRVETAGGRVVQGPVPAGEDGRFVLCMDPHGVSFRLWEAAGRPGAQLVNAPGAWNFSDLHAADPQRSAAFYVDVFRWEITDMGFGGMIRRPGYGDHLAATVDPGIHERQASVHAPPGFADAIGWLVPVAPEEQPHWHVSFTVADRDHSAQTVTRLGGTVLRTVETEWTREALVRDPQGAVFTVSQFTPPTD